METKTENADLNGAEFINTNLHGAQFRDVNLAEARFADVNLTGAVFHDVNCSDVSIADGRYDGMRIDGILVTELLRVYRAKNP